MEENQEKTLYSLYNDMITKEKQITDLEEEIMNLKILEKKIQISKKIGSYTNNIIR